MAYWENAYANQPSGNLYLRRYGTKGQCEAAQAGTGSYVRPDQCRYMGDVAPPLFVTDLYVRDIGDGWISVSASTQGAGTLVFSIDGVEKESYNIDENTVGQGTQFQLTPGSHTIKANNRFETITISGNGEDGDGDGACPEGKWYRRLPFFDCVEGYSSPEDTGGVFGFTGTGICYCDSDPEAQRKKEIASTEEWKEEETGGLADILKMLPQILLVMVVISIIGAFRK